MSVAPELVLGALRRAGNTACSGEELSHLLGVSRAQVWKHVEWLRGRGYRIEGEPGDGYRLLTSPDRLYPEELRPGLQTRWLGHELHYLESTDSTNRVAFDLARRGAAHGTAVIAEGQTAGRGRLGRSFFSPPFLNLYTSVILRPPLSTREAPTTVLAAAVAVAESVAAELGSGAEVEIKWPNDVLVNGKKSSGILMEMSAEATRVVFLILGIGVNLNVPLAQFPVELQDLATSLSSALGRPIQRVSFAQRLYGTLEEVLDLHAAQGFEALRPRFLQRFHMLGRHVRVAENQAAERSGRVQGIDDDGALLLQCDDGSTRRILAGDVTLAKEGKQG